ncbi:unnamed protein product [Urochloa decumbens]|uniref:Uncharacterized protein n=1 Tax=Urochloa decumbens TaxID=240449 RepID=A0ABC9H7W1_9POAL
MAAKLITNMAEEEVSMLLGVSSEITKLEDNMESIKAFLADAERRRITDQGVQRWVSKLKDAMYDVTDILDLCQLETEKRRGSKGGSSSKERVPGCFQSLLFCLRDPVFAHEIGSRIKKLNQRLDEIYKGAAKFNFITNLSSYQDPRMLTDSKYSSLKTMSEFDETTIVGENIERDTKELAQHFDESELLRSAITHAGGHHGGEQDKSKLVQTLTRTLSASRFLLVMDDVWGDSAWNNVLSVPVENASREQSGRRVLVTTRFEDLARKMRASLHQHPVRPLDGEDAWSLLKKQLPLGQEIDHLKSIGTEILKRCDGLPLAIKVIGGLLSTKYPSESEWKAVLNSPAWSVHGLPQELDKRMYLSYEDLAPPAETVLSVLHGIPKRDAQAADSCGLVRRLSIAATAVSVPDWAILKKQKSLRTLAIRSNIKYMPSGSLACFSSLRVLYIVGTDSDGLVNSLCGLKHLRFLHLAKTNISRLPEGIHKMKFLEYIALLDCRNLGHLPSSIIKLVHLRSLNITGSNVSTVPKGFGGLTNLRSLYGFPIHVDGMDRAGSSSSWCSLQELAPLSQLRDLTLYGLEKVPASWMAEKAMISSKAHLSCLELEYNRSSGRGGEACDVEEDVLEKLCPPTCCLENLGVAGGYAGRQLPNWMRAPASAANFKSLRYLMLEGLPCCTKLPDGLCCLPCLEMLAIEDVPAVKRIGSEFQAPDGDTAAALALALPFPRLRRLQLLGLCGWEEWEWNDDGCEELQGSAKATIAMPCLERLYIRNCKLSCLPPGLASINRHALRELWLYALSNLTSVENFPSVVDLDVFGCPELKRISGLSKLHKIRIVCCTNLGVLEGVPSLDSLVLWDATLETLPSYLPAVSPRYLSLSCNKKLYGSLSSPGSSECNKISHIGKRDISCLED